MYDVTEVNRVKGSGFKGSGVAGFELRVLGVGSGNRTED